MQDQFKYFVRLGQTRREMSPTNVRAIQLTYDINDSDRRFGFDENFSSELVFSNHDECGDFDFLYSIETSGNKCRVITLEIEKSDCSGNYFVWKVAAIRLVDSDFDLDNCSLSVKPFVLNDYSCITDNWEVEVNLLALPINKMTVTYVRGLIVKTQYDANTYLIDDPAHFGGVHPATLGWKCYKVIRHTAVLPPTYTFYYAREEIFTAANQNPGIDWILIETGGGLRKWARPPLLIFDWQATDTNPDFGDQHAATNFTIFGDELPGAWDNGMLLADLLNYFANNYCGIDVISNFLQINQDNTFQATYPTFQDGITYYHTVFQKSDVKRPNDQNNATKALYTFKSLLLSVCNMHNLLYRIENGRLRIEHVTYFQRPQTYDTTVGAAKRSMVRTRQYKYESAKLPRYELFKFMEDGSDDFKGLPIEYVGDCVNDNEGTGKSETDIEKVTTDVEFLMQNADPKSTKVSDDGLVIMATTFNPADGKYYPVKVAGTLETDMHVNNSLGWAFLHQQYHRYERLQLNGYLNGNYQNFLSTKPSKKRIRISIPFCCSDSIDLTGLILTDMGLARVGQAALVMYQDALEMDLLYQDDIGNLGCLRPKKFLLHEYRADTDAFYFETQFAVPGAYITEIEATKPDGSKQTFGYNPDQDGIYPATFPPHVNGLWRFRKRVLCDNDYHSPWSDYVSYALGFVECLALPQPIVFLTRGARPPLFIFRIVEPLTYPAIAVQAEVTRPGGTAYLVNNLLEIYAAGNHDVTVDINSSVPFSPSAPVPAGLYRFRFRHVCDSARGQYSPFSNYVDVNI